MSIIRAVGSLGDGINVVSVLNNSYKSIILDNSMKLSKGLNGSVESLGVIC